MAEEIRDLQATSSRVIQQSCRNPKDDARDERSKATFDVQLMSNFLNDGPENIKKRYLTCSQPQLWPHNFIHPFCTRFSITGANTAW